MTRRLDQLPREPADLARDLATLQRQVAELRAQRVDLSAADALLPPLDADPARWPQTTAAGYTAIATSSNVLWGTAVRLALTTTVSVGGTTGTVRVMVNGTQWGPAVAAGTTFDYTGPLPGVAIGDQYQLSVEAQRTGGAGAVAAQTRLIRSIP
ncbi:hypothetical protein F4556_002352 [Kitasatospora gansuensis]|uniref:Uncharacterized protein n=1 Tax=Kitasatospora gansuensis TaxID=258050 RepID=A0A7W7SAQ6_9ACTN|nr:hypothetical protein [Kitasatospora gansuensis]MBB4946817.1 hypothetical protein [Kitasatospora gansuensis]